MTKMLRMTEEQLVARTKRLSKIKKDWPTLKGEFIDNVVKNNAMLTTMQVKPSKYKNQRVGKYASKKEAERAAELKLLEKAGKIRDLKEQVKFLLIPAQYIDGKCVERACTYIADWTYEQDIEDESGSGWRFRVEDCKGMRTEVYRLKRKLMRFILGIGVREI